MTSTSTSGDAQEYPDWPFEAFKEFQSQAERLSHVTRLCVGGISNLTATPDLVEALALYNRTTGTDQHERELKAAREEAELAKREVNTGFPVLFMQATVGLWALLESTIRTVVVSELRNAPKALEIAPVSKLRIRLGDYERLAPDDRLHYVADLLEGEVAAGVRNGIERFEVLLKPFGLDGAVPDGLRQDMFEFGQVRNCIVHRGGRTDRQLQNACPWLATNAGEDLTIGSRHFERYQRAAATYVGLLLYRQMERFGIDVTEMRASAFTKYGVP
jgi:hypothetical protein